MRQSAHLCDLHTPVEKVLGADVVLVLSDVIQEAAIRHQLRDELNGRSEADPQQAAHMRIVNTSHHISFLRRKGKKPNVKYSLWHDCKCLEAV